MKIRQHIPSKMTLRPVDENFLQRFSISNLVVDAEAVSTLLDAKFSLASEMTPVRDQGKQGSCASFAVLSCLEFFNKKRLSPACITHETEKEKGDCKGGAPIGELMVTAQDKGVVEEDYWQYNYKKICWDNPPDVSTRTRYRFDFIKALYQRDIFLVTQNMQGASVTLREFMLPLSEDPVVQIKGALTQYHVPACISVPVFFEGTSDLDAGWEIGPDIKMPSPSSLSKWLELNSRSSLKTDGWHAIAISGYDEDHQRLQFKNSWSPFWGTKGYGTIPYEYVRAFSREGFVGFA